MSSFKLYKPRPIRFVELWNMSDWNIKIYRIYESEEIWNDAYESIAKQIASDEMQKLAGNAEVHKIGFLTIHLASMFNQIIFDYWARENELRHLVYKANADAPTSFENITASGEAFCVWELKVIGHERKAWIKYVLKKSEGPDWESYFGAMLDGEY